MIEVFMPKLGPSMEHGTVVRWYKSVGEKVIQGEPILDIETDKAIQEILAEADGTLIEILVADGETRAVGTVLAALGEAGESILLSKNESRTMPSPQSDAVKPIIPVIPASDAEEGLERLLIKSSPAARRVAREKGIALTTLNGTGPRGRIVVEDVLRAAEAPGQSGNALIQKTTMVVQDGSIFPTATDKSLVIKEKIQLSSTRRRIAERMSLSKREIPHFYASMDVNMSRVEETRTAWKNAGEAVIPSYNDFILWATAQVLKLSPELNSSLIGNEVTTFTEINIGMATAMPEGLIVPVIRRADQLSVRGIASQSKELVEKARNKKLLPADLEAGTFTISNLGMYGVNNFVAIINPPQCAILAVGQVAPRVVVEGSAIAIRAMATMTLSVDHRIADGVAASRFLSTVKTKLEKFGDEK